MRKKILKTLALIVTVLLVLFCISIILSFAEVSFLSDVLFSSLHSFVILPLVIALPFMIFPIFLMERKERGNGQMRSEGDVLVVLYILMLMTWQIAASVH